MSNDQPQHEGDLDDPMHKYLCARCRIEEREAEARWKAWTKLRREAKKLKAKP